MKKYSLESNDDGKIFRADECTGLIQCISTDDEFVDGFLLTFDGLSGGDGEQRIPIGEIFKISKSVNSKDIDIGYLRCERLLFEQNDTQVYLASLWNVDIKKIFVLECFAKGVQLGFRDLEHSYAPSWLSACSTFHFVFGHKGRFSNEVELDVSSLSTREEFYCHLGEVFFGYAGYAGQDLDGCHEVLQSRSGEGKIVVTIKDEDKVRAFLSNVTGQADYYDAFKALIGDLGGELVAG